MKSKFQCPSCQNVLQKQIAPAKSAKNPQPYVILWCGNRSRCPSVEAANNGGSGETEEAAYQSLLLAVKHEEELMDNAAEQHELATLTEEDQADRNAWAKAEHANDMQKSGGA